MKPGEAAVRLRVQVAAEDAHAHARKCLYQGMEQHMSFLIHLPDLSFSQEPGPVQHIPVQELIVRGDSEAAALTVGPV